MYRSFFYKWPSGRSIIINCKISFIALHVLIICIINIKDKGIHTSNRSVDVLGSILNYFIAIFKCVFTNNYILISL